MQEGPAPLLIPPVIRRALEEGAALSLSISGGKDGEAMGNRLVAAHREHGWPGPLFAIHADLGRAEWPQTRAHCQHLADRWDVPLIVVQRPQGDLVQEIEDRMHKLAGEKPHWPSSANRYCTSDQKRGQIDKVLRAPHWPDSKNRYCTSHHKQNQIDKSLRAHRVVISAEGIRAQESPVRARKQAVTIRQAITSKALRDMTPEQALHVFGGYEKGRLALTWYPIFDWSTEDVWAACGTSSAELQRRRSLYHAGHKEEALAGWPCHPAYVFGNTRLSCAICVLASKADIINGAKHNPELLRLYVEMERQSGYTFRQGLALADLLEATP
jgi:3'-phosphoadenosine 5'-phosphosulfate sulfotransferase (PAPS reductase)/FAD synthetase